MALNLETLALETNASLATCWDDLGVPEEERADYLRTLAQDVEAIYRSRVDAQEQRRTQKLEQIAALTSVIQNMQRAMEEPEAPVSRGAMTLTDFFIALETTRSALQETWDSRQSTLEKLCAQLTGLCQDVGAVVEGDFASIGERMSLARINAFEAYIARQAALKEERSKAVHGLCTAIAELWAEMDFAPENAYEEAIAQHGKGLGWTLSTIGGLEAKLAALNEERAAREERILAIGRNITALWGRLSTPVEEQTAFMESHCGLGDAVIAACETYLEGLKAEFAAKLVHLVAAARAAILSLWDAMLAGPQTRAEAFPPFFIEPTPDTLTDDLLAAHEAYIASAKAELASKMPILKAIEKRTALLEEKVEYETLIADPSRLLARGSSAARLREEKLERRVKKELPIVNKRLAQQIEEWQAAHGGAVLMISDAPFLSVLQAEDAAEARAKEDARAARGAAKADAAASAASAAAGGSGGGTAAMSQSLGRTSMYVKPGSTAAGTKRPSAPSASAAATAAALQLGAAPIIVKPRKTSGTAASAAAEATAAVAADASTQKRGAAVAPPPVPAAAPLAAAKESNKAAGAGGSGLAAAASKAAAAAGAAPAIAVSDAARTGAARIIQHM